MIKGAKAAKPVHAPDCGIISDWRTIALQINIPILFLRAAALLFAAAGALACYFLLPELGSVIPMFYPNRAFWQYPVLAGLYAAAACFFYALFHFWLMLNGIDREGLPPQKSMKAVRVISIIFTILFFVAAMPAIYVFSEAKDTPGVILLGTALGVLPMCAAATIAVLERIVKAAMPRRGERKPPAANGS